LGGASCVTERTYRAEPRSVVVLIAAADSARDSSKVKDARRRSAMRLGHQGLQKRQIPPLTESSCEGERRLEKATPGCLKSHAAHSCKRLGRGHPCEGSPSSTPLARRKLRGKFGRAGRLPSQAACACIRPGREQRRCASRNSVQNIRSFRCQINETNNLGFRFS
jgi:hypothetical protein